MSKYLTRENITLTLSIFGSLGTFFTWLYIFIKNRKNFDIKIVGHLYGYDNKSLLIFVSLTNKSRLPISITDIRIKMFDSIYQCGKIPVKVHEVTTKCKGEILSHHEYFSLSFPISLPELGGASGYLFFDFPELVAQPLSSQVTLLISSNRGKTVEKRLSLGRILD